MIDEAFLTTRFVNVNGITTRYADYGRGPTTILLIHGFPENLQGWRRNVPALSSHFRVIALDMVGFGETDKADWDYTCMGLAKFVKSFLEALGIPKVHVVGTDTGASVALAFAAEYPAATDKLIIFSGTAYPESVSAPEVRLMMIPGIGELSMLGFAGIGTRLSVLISYRDRSRLSSTALKEYLRCLDSFRARLIAVKCIRALDQTALLPLQKLKKSAPPALILWAEHDRYFYKWVPERLKSDLPGSRLEIVSDCGHFIQEEKPGFFNQRLITFIKDNR